MEQLYKLIDGNLIELSSSEVEQYNIDILINTKVSYLSSIKIKRDDEISAHINNVQVARSEDRENIQGSIEYFTMLSQGKGTITWTMADNTEKELSLQELQEVLDAYVIRKAQVFAEYQNKKQLIDNCTTVEELEAVVL